MLRIMVGACLMIGLWSALMLASVGVGAMQPLPPITEGLLNCESVCWRGIAPGQPLDDARAIAAQYGEIGTRGSPPRRINYRLPAETQIDWVLLDYYKNQVESVAILPAPQVRVGDLMAVLGAPEEVLINPNYTILLYKDGALGIIVAIGGDGMTTLSLFQQRILSIFISQDRNSGVPWHGFAPTWRYCQLETEIYGC